MTVPDFLLGRRAALTALLLGAVVFLALVVGGYSLLLGFTDVSVEDRLHQLALLKGQAAARPQVERALAALRLEAAAHPSLLHGESDTLTQATLQSELKTLVEADGGEVRSAFALPTVEDNGLALISVQYDIIVPVTKLRHLAYGIESHLPYLFISGADVTAPQSWPADAAAPAPSVEVRWTISGYRRSGGT